MKIWTTITCSLVLILLTAVQGIAQNLAFDPCDNGSEDSCTCDDAQVVCSYEDLDGLSFSTSSFQHADDGPDPLCPGPDGNGTTPNNPMWIAMIAQCEELTIEIHYYNCTVEGPQIQGLQVAVYSDCSNLPDSAIACSTSPDQCVNDEIAVLELEDLTIGDTYYMLFDGCAGSVCDVDLTVTDDCGIVQDNELVVIDDNDASYLATETLSSTALIDQQSSTTYQAGGTVTLDTGFGIENPQELEANILNCVTNP